MTANIKFSKGFTLIELIIVIAILGILAAVAVPKLFNITSDTQTNSVKYIAGALSAANGENYAVRYANSSKGAAVANCTDIAFLLQGGLPTGYSITSLAIAVGVTSSCTLNGPSATSATFNATGTS